MISKKKFLADGQTNRFLSDFLIRSEQFCRPYVYIYDNTLPIDGSGDTLQDGTTDQSAWHYPDNLWKRGADLPKSNDLATTDKWNIVDNSVLFYREPLVGTFVWVEVATTAEEFGDTLTQPGIYQAIIAAAASKAWATGHEPGGAGTKSSREWAELSQAQLSLVTTEGNTQVNRVITAGNVQVNRATTEADRSHAEANRAQNEANKAQISADKVIAGLRESYDFVSTAGQTTFTINYNVGLIDVFVDGIKLVDTVDYVATDGTHVMLNTPLVVGKEVNIVAYGVATYPDFITREW